MTEDFGKTIPARNTDPATSHEATEKITIKAGTQRCLILEAFAWAGADGYTDEEAAEQAEGVTIRSCWWKRCSELREAGLIVWVRDEDDEIVTRMGGMGVSRGVSRVTDYGLKVLAQVDD